MLHSRVLVGDNHIIHNWEVADLAALEALEVTAADRGKLAWQLDTDMLYFLISVEPAVWKPALGKDGEDGLDGQGGGSPSIRGSFSGPVVPSVGTLRYYVRDAGTLVSVFAALSGPAIEEVVAEVCLNGTAEWAVIIPVGEVTSVTEIELILVPNDYITINVISGKGDDLTLRLDY